MQLGLGTDIVSVGRMKQSLESGGKAFLDKVFTPYEQEEAGRHARPEAYLAMVFAAKEAVFKALKVRWEDGVKLTEIEVRRDPLGKPVPVLSGRFAQLAAEQGFTRMILSLSNDGDYAVATVIAAGAETALP